MTQQASESSTSSSRHLWALIDQHRRTYGTSITEMARQIGVTRQTLSAWRSDGLSGRLPTREVLDAVAAATNRPLRHVLEAALHDAGYLDTGTGPRDYDTVLADATAALTEAVSLTHSSHDGTPRNRIDWAALVCQAVAAAAANTGGTQHALDGRPGSWEAAHVGDILRSTVGEGDEYLMDYRTVPIEVNLNPGDVLEFLAPAVRESYEDANHEEWKREDDEARNAVDAQYDGLLDNYGERLTAAITENLRALNSRVPLIVRVSRDVVESAAIPDPDDIRFLDEPIERAIATALSQVQLPRPLGSE